MNEIEKLYVNAGIKPICLLPDRYCGMQPIYDDFTVEKQLALIKWLMKYDEIHAEYNTNNKTFGFSTLNYSGKYKKDFTEALASVINLEIWQDLTEEEKEQIRNILKG